ncbi:M14 family metallopeptidase [Butyricicoccus sp.]|uniref:M14 family metallopeptidase n=1 Tax=Butyricicoccus sp. TaxID=2049021 RepID=UPI003735D253
MIQEVVSVGLPVDERWKIIKNRMEPEAGARPDSKRICIVTGTHGDELEGQYVCYEVARRINEHMELLDGIVDIYPALNPLGIDSITRGIPMFDLDMNRIFPGSNTSATAEYVAAQIMNDMSGADMAVDIHASNIFLRETPQVRVNETTADNLLPYAKLLNTDFVWVHASATVLEATLAHSLNKTGVPCLVVEMGVGMRITKEYCMQLVDGIFRLMCELGIWKGEAPEVRDPIVSRDGHVSFVNAEASGIFVPSVEHWQRVKKGDHLGDIVTPTTGEILHAVQADVTGRVFTLREYPVVYSGSLIARVLEDCEEDAEND